jgi:hypothetical protein
MIELTSKQLRQAANIKDKIDELQNELSRLFASNGSRGNNGTTKAPRKRKMSSAARAKISAAAKARWAKIKGRKK